MMRPFEKIRYSIERGGGRIIDDDHGASGCAAYMPCKTDGENVTLGIIASWQEGWDHVSVSLGHRTPTWGEMCFVKDLFFEPREPAYQFHPPRENYVNIHPHCLHMWRPHGCDTSLPPLWMV